MLFGKHILHMWGVKVQGVDGLPEINEDDGLRGGPFNDQNVLIPHIAMDNTSAMDPTQSMVRCSFLQVTRPQCCRMLSLNQVGGKEVAEPTKHQTMPYKLCHTGKVV